MEAGNKRPVIYLVQSSALDSFAHRYCNSQDQYLLRWSNFHFYSWSMPISLFLAPFYIYILLVLASGKIMKTPKIML